MSGGSGDDPYCFVDNENDAVREEQFDGIDLVRSSIDF